MNEYVPQADLNMTPGGSEIPGMNLLQSCSTPEKALGYIPTLDDGDLNSFFDPTEMLQKKFPEQIEAEKKLKPRSKTVVRQKKVKQRGERPNASRPVDLSNGPFYDQIKDLVENEQAHNWQDIETRNGV